MLNKYRRSPIWILFCIVLLDLLGFGIVIPILPLLFTDLTSPFSIMGREFSVQNGYIFYGLLLATYPLFQFFAAPVLGQLSDKYGRRKILLISLTGTGISYLLFGIGLLTRNIPLLFFARAIDGITGGNISVAQAIVADISSAEQKTRYFGLLGAGFGIGLIMGPYLGGKLSDPAVVSWFNLDVPFWFAAFLSFSNAIAVYFLLPETLRTLHSKTTIRWFQSVTNIMRAYELKKFHALFLTGFLYQCSFAFFTAFISVFLYKHFGFKQSSIGEYFAYAGIWIAITQAFITKHAYRRFKDTEIVGYGLIGCTVFIFIFFLINSTWELYILTAFFAIFNGLVQTSILSLVSNTAEESSQGKILGINSSVYAIAQAIPPLVSGFLAASLQSEAPIVTAGIFSLLSAVLFLALYRGRARPHAARS